MDLPDGVIDSAVVAIQQGDTVGLLALLAAHPQLATLRVRSRGSRSLLHVATDWPGHLPGVASTIRALVDAGADPDVRAVGRHPETPLHWAASSDDTEAIEALLDAGADIDAPGAVIGGGTPLADATAFGQWRAARLLVDRGARVSLWEAAALGMLAEVQRQVAGSVTAEDVTSSFWGACHGGQQETAAFLLDLGADLDWVGWDQLTPLDAATRNGDPGLVQWLVSRGARSAPQLS